MTSTMMGIVALMSDPISPPLCKCGHVMVAHVFHKGAYRFCRPGHLCRCAEYRPAVTVTTKRTRVKDQVT